MMDWIRENRKRLLAFIGVFLMVAFLLPTFRSHSMTDPHIATLRDGRKIHAREVENAYNEWNYLKHSVLLPTSRGGQQDWDTILAHMDIGIAAQDIEEHKLLFFVLMAEAQRMGAQVTPGQLEGVLDAVNVRLPDGRIVAYQNIKDTQQGRSTRQCVADLLSIQSAFRRAASAMKITAPQRNAELAMQMQSLNLHLVPFMARDFEAAVTEPTTDEMKAQFEKYADQLPDLPTTENPFGFGYKVPDRVKLQYISVQRDEIRRAVMDDTKYGATPEDRQYYWQKEARRYYLKNPAEFKAAPPATTQSAPISIGTAPTTGPTIRPFEEVQQQAIDKVVNPEVDRVARQVQGRITTALAAEYVNYTKARAASQPAAATSLGPTYDKFDYLQALSADLQKQFGVVAKVVNLGDQPRSRSEVAKLEGIKDAWALMGQQPIDFADYVFNFAEALAPRQQKEQPALLSVMEPSQLLLDGSQSFYVFRLTDVEPSHRPASLDQAAEQVRSDLKMKKAQDAATAAARKLLDEANASSLDSAATAAKKRTVTVNEFRAINPPKIDELPGLRAFSEQQFVHGAFDLLAQPDNPQHPARAVIELPYDHLVLVAELEGVTGGFPAELIPLVQAQMTQQLEAQYSRPLAMAWFSYASVAQRNGLDDPSVQKTADAGS